MIGQYLSNKTKIVLFICLKFFQHLEALETLMSKRAVVNGQIRRWNSCAGTGRCLRCCATVAMGHVDRAFAGGKKHHVMNSVSSSRSPERPRPSSKFAHGISYMYSKRCCTADFDAAPSHIFFSHGILPGGTGSQLCGLVAEIHPCGPTYYHVRRCTLCP
jgi:hypothetical protein